MILVYQIEDLNSAREYLAGTNKPLIITNSLDIVKYYGFLTLDYIFTTLSKEFSQIAAVIANIGDDHSALFTALKLNYHNIKYTGNSNTAKIMLAYRAVYYTD